MSLLLCSSCSTCDVTWAFHNSSHLTKAEGSISLQQHPTILYMWNSPLPAPALEPAVFMMRVGIFSVMNFSFSSKISACRAKVLGGVQRDLCAPMLVHGHQLMCISLCELWPARGHQ